jgi:hypothetical protein
MSGWCRARHSSAVRRKPRWPGWMPSKQKGRALMASGRALETSVSALSEEEIRRTVSVRRGLVNKSPCWVVSSQGPSWGALIQLTIETWTAASPDQTCEATASVIVPPLLMMWSRPPSRE